MARYDTNLASEYYVLSCLHRLGLTANLTLGNKKGVDVVVVRESGDAVTVEVKGLAGKYEWPANNLVSQTPRNPDRHFAALVSFEGRIQDRHMPPPRVWIIPFPALNAFTRAYPGKRINVSRSEVLRSGGDFEDAWHLIGGMPEPPAANLSPLVRSARQLSPEQRAAAGVRLRSARAAKLGLTLEQFRDLRLRPGQRPTAADIARVKSLNPVENRP